MVQLHLIRILRSVELLACCPQATAGDIIHVAHLKMLIKHVHRLIEPNRTDRPAFVNQIHTEKLALSPLVRPGADVTFGRNSGQDDPSMLIRVQAADGKDVRGEIRALLPPGMRLEAFPASLGNPILGPSIGELLLGGPCLGEGGGKVSLLLVLLLLVMLSYLSWGWFGGWFGRLGGGRRRRVG